MQISNCWAGTGVKPFQLTTLVTCSSPSFVLWKVHSTTSLGWREMVAVPPTTPLSTEPVSLHCTSSKTQPGGMPDSLIVYWPVGTFTKLVCAWPLVVLRLKALG